MDTGELKQHTFYEKRKFSEGIRFMKLFGENKSDFFKLGGISMQIFFCIITDADYNNYVTITPGSRKAIAEMAGVKPNYIYIKIRELQKHNFLRKVEEYTYMVNPYIAGRGKDVDIFKFRDIWDTLK